MGLIQALKIQHEGPFVSLSFPVREDRSFIWWHQMHFISMLRQMRGRQQRVWNLSRRRRVHWAVLLPNTNKRWFRLADRSVIYLSSPHKIFMERCHFERLRNFHWFQQTSYPHLGMPIQAGGLQPKRQAAVMCYRNGMEYGRAPPSGRSATHHFRQVPPFILSWPGFKKKVMIFYICWKVTCKILKRFLA